MFKPFVVEIGTPHSFADAFTVPFEGPIYLTVILDKRPEQTQLGVGAGATELSHAASC